MAHRRNHSVHLNLRPKCCVSSLYFSELEDEINVQRTPSYQFLAFQVDIHGVLETNNAKFGLDQRD